MTFLVALAGPLGSLEKRRKQSSSDARLLDYVEMSNPIAWYQVLVRPWKEKVVLKTTS